MSSYLSPSKIQPEHLDRNAVIYVRQSSFIQVRDNTASTMRKSRSGSACLESGVVSGAHGGSLIRTKGTLAPPALAAMGFSCSWPRSVSSIAERC